MPDRNVEVALDFLNTMSRDGMTAAINKCCTSNFVWWAPSQGEVQNAISQFEIIMIDNMDEEGLTFTVKGITVQDDRVAIEAESHAKLKSGARYNNHYHFLFIVTDGKIARLNEYNDSLHSAEIWGAIMAAAMAD